MSKQQLYAVIAVLLGIVLYLLFMPARTPVPTPVPVEPAATTTEAIVSEPVAPASDAPTASTESVVTIEGLFLGLAEEATNFRQSFYYLLLDDGTEVVRIDLRPLIGYSTSDVIEKLGVDRGTRVVVTGTMAETGFQIATITAAE